MEEIEVPLEKSQEDIHEHAHHAGGWIAKVALCTASLLFLRRLQFSLAREDFGL